MSPKKQAYEILANNLIKKFNLRGIEGYYCTDKETALNTAKRFLTPDCSISFGGSETLKEIGLISHLKESDYVLYDRANAKTEDEQTNMYSKIVTSDYFFMSSNAITLDGELINIDGNGNRVACLIHGPKNVIIIAGMNKIVTDIPTGIDRIRNFACSANAIRLNNDTPCSKLGHCGNCISESSMCSQLVITRTSRKPNRIKVILVGEELGY